MARSHRVFLAGVTAIVANATPVSAQPVTEALAGALPAHAQTMGALMSATLATLPPVAVVLALVPLLLVLTAFTRIVIVLGFLRQGLGVNSIVPGMLITVLAFALTVLTLAPLAQQIVERLPTPQPGGGGNVDWARAAAAVEGPMRAHLLNGARPEDLAMLAGLSGCPRPERPADLTLPVLASGYLLGEVRTAFQIGIVVLLPFLLVDLLVSALSGALALPSFPAAALALVLKLYLFVAVDGWTLITGSLLRSLR